MAAISIVIVSLDDTPRKLVVKISRSRVFYFVLFCFVLASMSLAMNSLFQVGAIGKSMTHILTYATLLEMTRLNLFTARSACLIGTLKRRAAAARLRTDR
jgi:hypothetical protein